MRVGANKLDDRRVEQLLVQGLTHRIIAQRLGCHESAIYAVKKRIARRKQAAGADVMTHNAAGV